MFSGAMADTGDSGRLEEQLDSVLSRFYDFGDDFKCPEVVVPEREQDNEGEQPEKHGTKTNKPEDHPLPIVHSKKGKKNASLFFNAIKEELNSQPKCADAPIQSDLPQNVKVVTFVSHKNKKRTKNMDAQDKDSKIDSKVDDDISKIFDFEKARLEIHKFGVKGYKKEKQREFEQDRAIMLGAKPPKKEYVNCKVHQERKRKLDQAKKEKGLTEGSFEPVKKKKNRRLRPKGLSANALSGQVGKFRDGALFLSSRDIYKIKKSKVPK